MAGWTQALGGASHWEAHPLISDGFTWPSQAGLILLPCLYRLETALIFSCLKTKTKPTNQTNKKPIGLGQKIKPKNPQIFTRRQVKGRALPKLSDPFPFSTRPQQKACQQILFTTLEENTLLLFSLLWKISLQRGDIWQCFQSILSGAGDNTIFVLFCFDHGSIYNGLVHRHRPVPLSVFISGVDVMQSSPQRSTFLLPEVSNLPRTLLFKDVSSAWHTRL